MAARTILAGVGSCLPERVVSNDELSSRLDTSDQWITDRTGIRQRRIAGPHETTCFMATEAARRALEHSEIPAERVDAVIAATSTPDQIFPATAVRVQAALGLRHGFGFDLSAACSGFIYALSVADAMIRAGQAETIVVIGVDLFSRLVDWQDRATCVLFGDGAGAVVLRRTTSNDDPTRGVLSTHLHADGTYGDLLYTEAANPAEAGARLRMNGKEVFRHAVNLLAATVDEALAAHGLGYADVDFLVPHQANRRIIDAMGRKLGLPPERVVITVDRHANTSAASIPLALDEAWRDGRIRQGQLIVMEALGGGLTWGSALIRL